MQLGKVLDPPNEFETRNFAQEFRFASANSVVHFGDFLKSKSENWQAQELTLEFS